MIARIPLKVSNTLNNEEIDVALVAVSVEELNELEAKLQRLEQAAQQSGQEILRFMPTAPVRGSLSPRL